LTGKTASDHNLLPEIRAYVAKARLRRGIELVKLANRIEALKMQEDEEGETAEESDMPERPMQAAGEALAVHSTSRALTTPENAAPASQKGRLSKLAKSAIFREVVLAKVREMKEAEAQKEFEKTAAKSSKKA
jgi:calcium/calmodulin-dependent protein kinase I